MLRGVRRNNHVRVAKKPVALPKGVELNVQADSISAKGPKGTLSVPKPAAIDVKVEDGTALFTTEDAALIPLTGTLRAILSNMVKGVSEGFERKLELVGVGYRASMQGKDLNLALGFSHPVVFAAPEGITITTPTQTEILVAGRRQAACRRSGGQDSRFPSAGALQGQGCEVRGEVIIRKEAKKA